MGKRAVVYAEGSRRAIKVLLEKLYANKAELQFAATARRKGWFATKRGWPDFLCFHPAKGFIAVEVKRVSTHMPRLHQAHVMDFLTEHGVRCFVWSPDEGLVPFRKLYKRGSLVPEGIFSDEPDDEPPWLVEQRETIKKARPTRRNRRAAP